MKAHSFRTAWSGLASPYHDALKQAHRSLRRNGLAVGAAITDTSGVTIAVGRNRAYDPIDGTDPLENTPIAHAEMNAMARISSDADPGELKLWSTHQPCAMCAAAARFIGLEAQALASDPSDPGRHPPETTDEWIIVATALFLLGPGLRRRDHPMLDQHRSREPEAVEFTEKILYASSHPLLELDSVDEALEVCWDHIVDAADRRRNRYSTDR